VPAVSADRPPLADRHARARALMASVGVSRLLVTSLPNVTWLTGFDGSSACAMVEPHQVVLVTDRRYGDVAAALAGEAVQVALVEQTYDETLAGAIAAGPGPVGFEAGHLTVQRHRWLAAALEARGWAAGGLRPTVDVIEAGRLIKDAWEVDRLREAGRRISAVALGVLADIRPGQRESEVAQAVEAGLRRAGFSRPAFDTIVASGPRAALPHGRASDRMLAAGELVVLDFGGVYGGYCVDLTRTVELGPGAPEARRVHAAVAEAQAAAIAAIRPGVRWDEVDAAAREVIARHGLADGFVHGTGHGLGLEVHEAPRVGPHRAGRDRPPMDGTVALPDTAAAGMVVTIEPGVYLPGWGGVRIEDDLLVTAAGAERLTGVPVTLAAPSSV
jgi:Xaa-Pro aminopeptidase